MSLPLNLTDICPDQIFWGVDFILVCWYLSYIYLDFDIEKWKKNEQAGTELGQAQLQLELGFTSIKIWGIALLIANCYNLLHITEQD